MIITFHEMAPCDKDNKIHTKPTGDMADSMFMFYVTAGIFAFLVAVVFGARAKRYSAGYTPAEGHSAKNE
jgi:hypothetical protein